MSELKTISIRGAREHNLKGIDLDLPRNKLIVMTGLSGSGKSSLAFDTIYAEGQRRYVESLSAYARQFLEMIAEARRRSDRRALAAISIEQKPRAQPRSTVGTVTEIYDYLRLLFGASACPILPPRACRSKARPSARWSTGCWSSGEETRLYMLAPLRARRKGEYRKELAN